MKSLSKTFTVKKENTAKTVGSGDLEVLSTPILTAWMENTAMSLSAEHLQEGDTTVGISIHVEHTKASAIEEAITCTAIETGIEGRKLSYKIECKDSKGDIVGTATHDRFIVNAERFMSKLAR